MIYVKIDAQQKAVLEAEMNATSLSVGPLLDRLTHRCHIVQFSGDSYRFRQSLERQQQLADVGREALNKLQETAANTS